MVSASSELISFLIEIQFFETNHVQYHVNSSDGSLRSKHLKIQNPKWNLKLGTKSHQQHLLVCIKQPV